MDHNCRTSSALASSGWRQIGSVARRREVCGKMYRPIAERLRQHANAMELRSRPSVTTAVFHNIRWKADDVEGWPTRRGRVILSPFSLNTIRLAFHHQLSLRGHPHYSILGKCHHSYIVQQHSSHYVSLRSHILFYIYKKTVTVNM